MLGMDDKSTDDESSFARGSFWVDLVPLRPHTSRMTTGRSPLKSPPLHNPGESLQQQREEFRDNDLTTYWIVTGILILMAGFAWLDHFGILPINPNALTVVAIWALAFSVVQFFRVRKQIRSFNRGIEAEKAVGQFLEQFRKEGYAILHDVPGESGGKKFNVDHVLIGPKGIFTVETKGRTKPQKGQCKVVYDGQQVTINGQAPDRDPIVQAKAQAAWLEDLLKSCTALKSVPITPLVVFPGWYVDYGKARNAQVKVTTEQLIGSCIRSSPHSMDPHDVKLVESRLTDHIQRAK